MICFRVTSLPSIGDHISHDGCVYQIITNVKNSGMKSLSKAKARYTTDAIYWEKEFYFELV